MAVVAGALAVAGVIAVIRHRRASAQVPTVQARGFSPGVYFFSSVACPPCEQTRNTLVAALGTSGYEEFVWEHHPETFTEYGVDQVPAIMIVDDGGLGRIYFGQPDPGLLGP